MTHVTYHVTTYGSTSCGTRMTAPVSLPAVPGIQIDADRSASAPSGRTVRRPAIKRRLDPVLVLHRVCLELLREDTQ